MASWEYETAKLIFERNKKTYKTVNNNSSAYDNNDKTYIDTIYNRIKGMIKAFNTIDENFPFELNDKCYSVSDIADFIECIQKLIDSDSQFTALKRMDIVEYFNEKEVSERPNKNLLSNIKKGDAEYELDRLICLMIKYGDCKLYGNSFLRCFNYDRKRYNMEVTNRKQDFSVLIRTKSATTSQIASECFDIFKQNYCYNLSNNINERKNMYHIQYDMQEAMYLILEEIDVFEFVYLQIINYKIMSNDEFSHAQKENMLKIIKKECQEFNDSFHPKISKAVKQNIFYSFAVYLMFLTVRNEYNEYGNIIRLLVDQMKKADYKMTVPIEFRYKAQYISDLDSSEQMFYILEGERTRKERFESNIQDCMHLISLLDTITGRWLGAEYLQHIKVVYREIILDKLAYNHKTSRTIMRNIEEKDYPYFESIKESVFIREKISRGLFREKDVVDLYELKCEIQYLLEGALLKVFSTYDEVRIAKDFNSIYKGYSKILIKIFEEE